MSLARKSRLIEATKPDPWAKYEQHEANIEAVVSDWREGWARDAMLIPAWNEMTVEEAIAFVRGGEADRG
jgi:hypothetical protein